MPNDSKQAVTATPAKSSTASANTAPADKKAAPVTELPKTEVAKPDATKNETAKSDEQPSETPAAAPAPTDGAEIAVTEVATAETTPAAPADGVAADPKAPVVIAAGNEPPQAAAPELDKLGQAMDASGGVQVTDPAVPKISNVTTLMAGLSQQTAQQKNPAALGYMAHRPGPRLNQDQAVMQSRIFAELNRRGTNLQNVGAIYPWLLDQIAAALAPEATENPVPSAVETVK